MKYGRQLSAGGVLFRETKPGYEVALIKVKGGTVHALPKGLIDKGEKPEGAAIREVREETGMLGELVAPLGSIDYYYYSRDDDTRYFKQVYFFLLRYTSGRESDHDWEVEEVEWVPAEEAVEILAYKGEREVMRRALEVLGNRAETASDERHQRGVDTG